MRLPGDISITRRAFNAIAEKAWFLVALFPWRAGAIPNCCPFYCVTICNRLNECCLSGTICWVGYNPSLSLGPTGPCCPNSGGCYGSSWYVVATCCGSPSYSIGSYCCR
jgi:hypothetical protein